MKKSTYHLKGISGKQAANAESRKEVIVSVVRQNPKRSQNQLKEAVCDKLGAMSGKTFDSLIVELRNGGILSYEKIKNRIHYSVPKDVAPKDLSFLGAMSGELFHMKKIMRKSAEVFSTQRPGAQITQVIAFSEYLQYMESAFIVLKPLYDDTQRRKLEKRFSEIASDLHLMIRKIKVDHIRLLCGQFFGYASVKRVEIEKLTDYKNNTILK